MNLAGNGEGDNEEEGLNPSGKIFRVSIDDSKFPPFFETEKVTVKEIKFLKSLKNRLFDIKNQKCSKVLNRYSKYLNRVHKRKIDLKEIFDECYFYKYFHALGWKKNPEIVLEMTLEEMEWSIINEPDDYYVHPQRLLNGLTAIGAENTQVCYNFGYTKIGDPVVWMKLADYKHFIKPSKAKTPQILLFVQFVNFIVMDVQKHMPNGKRRFTMVIDAKNVGWDIIGVALKFGKEISENMNNFIDVLQTGIIVNSGWLMTSLWKVCQPFLYETTRKKWSFCKDNKSLHQYIHVNQIPEKYGGRMKLNYTLKDHVKLLNEERTRMNARKKAKLLRSQKTQIKPISAITEFNENTEIIEDSVVVKGQSKQSKGMREYEVGFVGVIFKQRNYFEIIK